MSICDTLTLVNTLSIEVGPLRFMAKLEWERAPQTCEAFRRLLPFENRVIHSRWSGEAVWIPLGDFDTGLGFENHTSHPSRGDILLYPGGFSETEILFAYGSCRFASKMGVLAGNHFLTVTGGREQLADLGKLVLWQGAQRIVFRAPGKSARPTRDDRGRARKRRSPRSPLSKGASRKRA